MKKTASLRWDSYFVLLLFFVTLLRLGYLYIVPLDLGPEESGYWNWSQRLGLGYYGEPPLLAWLNAFSASLLGHSAQMLRIPAVALGAIGLLGIYLCGRRMFSAETAFWGVAAWLATPGAAVIGLLMTPDALLLCCWSLALYTLWRAVETPRAKLRWWLPCLLLIGIGTLSAPMMLIFPPLLFFYLLIGGEDRAHLKQRWPWLLWLGSLLFLLPQLWWNFRHGWASVSEPLGRLQTSNSNLLDYLKSFAAFIGTQAALLTPITWLLLVLLLLFLLPLLFKQSRQVRFLFIFSAVGILCLGGFSAELSLAANLPATFYPAGLLLLAAWGRGQVNASLFDRLQKWFIPGLKLGVLLTLVAYLLPFVLQLNFIPLADRDPSKNFKGWSRLEKQLAASLQEQPRPEQTFILSATAEFSAPLAFYSHGKAPVYRWSENPAQAGRQSQLWPGPVGKLGWDGLIVQAADLPLSNELVNRFENVVPLAEKSIPRGAAGELRYKLWRGENLLNWPE